MIPVFDVNVINKESSHFKGKPILISAWLEETEYSTIFIEVEDDVTGHRAIWERSKANPESWHLCAD